MEKHLPNHWTTIMFAALPRLKRPCLLFLLSLLSQSLHASNPPLFEADYTLKRGNFTVGVMHRSLRKEGNTFIFESSAKPKGFLALFSSHKIQEKSQWTFENNRIISQNFSYQSGSKKKLKRSNIVFHPTQSIAHGKDRGRAWQLTFPTEQSIYDRANYQIALMQDLRDNKPTLRYLFIKRGKLKDYHFIRRGKETIKTPLGSLVTIKVERQKDKRATTIWLAPSLNYVPVKIEQVENDGTLYLLSLKHFKDTPTERINP